MISDTDAGQFDPKATPSLVTLDAARLHLSSTQEIFSKLQENLRKDRELSSAQSDQLTSIQRRLTSLSQTTSSLADIKSILEITVSLILNIKQNIMSLCRSFYAVSVTIDALMNSVAPAFIPEIQNPSQYKIGEHILAMWQASILYQAALTLLGQFSATGTVVYMVSFHSQ